MGTLSLQFFDVIQRWSEKTGFSENDLRLYILDRVGPSVNWIDVEMELETLQNRVEELIHPIGINEKFLIAALVQAIDKIFMLQINNLAQGEDASIAIGNSPQVRSTKETVESKDERSGHSKILGRLGILL